MRVRLFWSAIVLILCPVGIGAEPALAQDERGLVLYQAPVSDVVIDPFRPPAHIGASGNRGLEYGNPPRRLVVAAADGTVTFAGQVAGSGVVTIQHDDGVRTSYVGLGDLFVEEGDMLWRGDHIAVAVVPLHFGARIHEHYLDPQILIDASQPSERARLVPEPHQD